MPNPNRHNQVIHSSGEVEQAKAWAIDETAKAKRKAEAAEQENPEFGETGYKKYWDSFSDNKQSRRVLTLADRLLEARREFPDPSADVKAYHEQVADREMTLRETMQKYDENLSPELKHFINDKLFGDHEAPGTRVVNAAVQNPEVVEAVYVPSATSAEEPDVIHVTTDVLKEMKEESGPIVASAELSGAAGTDISSSNEKNEESTYETDDTILDAVDGSNSEVILDGVPDEMNKQEVNIPESNIDSVEKVNEIGSPLDAIEAAQVKRAYEFRQDSHVPTGSRFWNRKEQTVRVNITEPITSNEQLSQEEWDRRKLGSTAMRLVNLNAFTDEVNRPDGTRWRDAFQALNSDMPVVTINSQGVETPTLGGLNKARGARLTLQQAKNLLKGSFKDTGKAQYEAFKRATGSEGDIYIHAASKGVADAAGFIRAAVEDGAGERLRGVVLHEGVNYKKRSLGKLALQFFTKSGDANEAHKSNPELMQGDIEGAPKWIGRVAMSAVANALYGQALSKGKFLNDLGNPNDLAKNAPNLKVVLANGSESVISPTKDNEEIKRELERAGINVEHIVLEGGNHNDAMNEQVAAQLNGRLR